MNAPGDQLFAATGFAANQDSAVVAGHLPHELVEPDEWRSSCRPETPHTRDS